jgi:hypothetical protein
MTYKKMTEKVQYFARRFLFLSVLDPTTYERQALINKVLMVFLVALLVAFVNLLLRFNSLSDELTTRKIASSQRVNAWQKQFTADSIRRLEWDALHKAEILKLQKDSIQEAIGGPRGIKH